MVRHGRCRKGGSTLKTSLRLGALLLFSATAAVAQPAPAPPAPPVGAGQDATARTDTDAAMAQQKAEAATRAQIRAIRMALKARLAALHH